MENDFPFTLLVADFNSSTGDAVFSGTLESMCTKALEETPFVNIYSRVQHRDFSPGWKNGATKLDEPAARKIAIRQSISVIVAGRAGDLSGDFRASEIQGSIQCGGDTRIPLRCYAAVQNESIWQLTSRTAGARGGV